MLIAHNSGRFVLIGILCMETAHQPNSLALFVSDMIASSVQSSQITELLEHIGCHDNKQTWHLGSNNMEQIFRQVLWKWISNVHKYSSLG